MATWREDDNGARLPSDDGREPVAGLPAEWGRIVIPDDISELADEVTRVRRQLRWAARRGRWFGTGSILRAPIMIIGLALLLGLSSLLSIAGPLGRAPSSGPSADPGLADITLTDEKGTPVRFKDQLPAAVLLLDGCTCVPLATSVAHNVPSGVSVLLVGKQPPAATGLGMRLGDPAGQVRKEAGAGIPVPDKASVILLDRTGKVTRLIPGTNTVDDFSSDLLALAG
ncbi:hypothetical protein [Longispora albida]|uniref:hypothetical protein n=1 Tax=Longispora albida TaxID=203523 RepID=UPI00037721C5|nr:hypothetical protein [Longispora albida]